MGRNKRKKYKTIKVKLALLILLIVVIMAIILILTKKEIMQSSLSANDKTSYAELTETLTWDISASDDDDVTATLTTDGVLTISGTGEMTDWAGTVSTAYLAYREYIVEVIVEDGVKNIGSYAFNFCTRLTSIDLSNSAGLTSIGSEAFYYCTRLTSIDLSNCTGLTSIGSRAFMNCTSLTSITIDGNNEYYSSEDGVLFNKDKTTIKCYPAGKEEETYTIPESVTTIAGYAFYKCTSLTSIDLSNCTGLSSIGGFAFYECTSLTSIDLSDCAGLTSIGSEAFTYCTSLTSITIDGNNEYYSSEDGVLFNKDKTEIICYPAGKEGETYTIPESVTIIEYYAFYYCTSLTSIELSDCTELSSIGSYAFYKCTSLISIDLSSCTGLKSIAYYAFMNCTSLTSIDLSNCTELTRINTYAFFGCTSLESVEIPESVNVIGAYAFKSCTSLKSVEIPDSVTSIETGAFYYCKSLTITDIPGSVTSIGSSAFYGVTYSAAVAFPDDATDEVTIDLPDIIKRTLDEEDIMYADGSEPTLTNCTISYDDETMTFSVEDLESVEIYITSGALYGMTVALEGGDLTPPSVDVSYSTTETTNGSVTVTITASEEIQSVSGWTLSSDRLILTKEYTENTEETVTIYDIAGNSTEVTISITNISTDTSDEDEEDDTVESYVLYLYNGDTLYSSQEIIQGEYVYIADLPSLTQTGYTFNGWTDVDGNIIEEDIEITGDITLYASWTENSSGDDDEGEDESSDVETYTITLDLNGGYILVSDTKYYTYSEQIESGNLFTYTDTPVREDYEFAGWEDEEGSITETIYIEEVTLDMTFTATWTEETNSGEENDENADDENSTETETETETETTDSTNSNSTEDETETTNSNTSSTSSSSTTNTSADTTTSASSLPYTGSKAVIIGVIIAFGAIAIIVRKKWNDLNGI